VFGKAESVLKNKKIGFIVAAALLWIAPAAAQTPRQNPHQGRTELRSEILWDSGLIRLHLESVLPLTDTPLPVVKYNQQQANRRALPGYLRTALGELTVDSFFTFPQLLNEKPELINILDELASQAILTGSQLSLDQKTLIMDFEVSLFPGLTTPFLSPGALSPGSLVSWEPSAEFTGIVIYAGDFLPVHGERDAQGRVRMAQVKPCLCPKIMDENLNLLFSPELMDPRSLAEGGAAGYTHSTETPDSNSRVGNYPFFTTALGLFGKNATDLILPQADVRRLLSRPENRELLRRGRVIIIY
jgi:hypothetical protein